MSHESSLIGRWIEGYNIREEPIAGRVVAVAYSPEMMDPRGDILGGNFVLLVLCDDGTLHELEVIDNHALKVSPA